MAQGLQGRSYVSESAWLQARLQGSCNASHRSMASIKIRWQCGGSGHPLALTDADVGCCK